MSHEPAVYSSEEFTQLIARETDDIELKTGLGNKPLHEVIVAMSNTDGGSVFVGVDDARNVVGWILRDSGTEPVVTTAVRHDVLRLSPRVVPGSRRRRRRPEDRLVQHGERRGTT